MFLYLIFPRPMTNSFLFLLPQTKVTYETSDHVDGHYAEDSGTYSTQSSSKDFVTRPSEPRTATHVYPGSINALPSYETFGVNNPQNVADPAVTCGAVTTVNKCEPNRKETFDHDLTYAQHGFDILDYAGQLPVMEERVFSSRNSDINDDFISRPPKKPRSESPSPRLKMYRMKMF